MATKIGVFTAWDAARIATFSAAIGNTVDFAEAHGGSKTFADMRTSASQAGKTLLAKVGRVQYSQPMLPKDGTGNLAALARGEYDDDFLDIAIDSQLAEAPKDGSPLYVSLGKEQNGDWMPWAARKDYAGYIAAWRRIAGKYRAASPRFKMVWCPNYGQEDPTKSWPGADVVDVIAVDFYLYAEHFQAADKAFADHKSGSYALEWFRAFAAKHGKPLAIDEFGHNVSDSIGAAWLDKLTGYLPGLGLEWVCYFDDGECRISGGSQRLSCAALGRLYAALAKGATTTPIPVTPAPVETAPVAANPALDLCARINGEAYKVTQAKAYSGPALAVYYKVEDLAYWPRTAGKEGKETDPIKALALIRDAVAAVDTKGWPAAARAQVRGWHDAAVALVGEVAPVVTPPVVVTPTPNAEVTALRAEVAGLRAMLAAVRAALA